jgi:hypothetical protein
MPPDADFAASGHGSCHRPACPVSHGGQAQSREARVFDANLSAGASVDVCPVESVLSTTSPEREAFWCANETRSVSVTP